MRVLVVDDDAELLRRISSALAAAGCKVRCATDGAVALARLRDEPADLVLTDIIMPNREGIETMLAVRALLPHAKVIAMSGGGRIGGHEFLVLAKSLGADAVLSKPFRLEEMVRLVFTTLDVEPGPKGQAA